MKAEEGVTGAHAAPVCTRTTHGPPASRESSSPRRPRRDRNVQARWGAAGEGTGEGGEAPSPRLRQEGQAGTLVPGP